jgi:hypothetical protein
MTEYRVTPLEAVDPGVEEVVVEERVEGAPTTVRRVVVPGTPPLAVTQPVTVRETVAVPTPVVATTVPVRRWWRRSVHRAPAPATYTVPVQTLDPAMAQLFRILWFGLGVLEAVLATRFLIALLGGNPRNPFAALVYAVSWPFAAPFETLFATPAAGGSVFELTTLVAMLMYFLAWWGIVKTLAVVTNRPVEALE